MDGTKLVIALGYRLGCMLSEGTAEGLKVGILDGSMDFEGMALGVSECVSVG